MNVRRPPPGGKIGMTPGALGAALPGGKAGMTELGNRAVATPPSPQVANAAGANRARVYTWFTNASSATEILYDGDRLWARVTVELQTAGPVVIGTDSNLTPVLGGKGVVLTPGEPRSVNIARGTKLYIASTAVNRVAVVVEAVPWLEQITGAIGVVGDRITDLLAIARSFLK